MDGIGNTNTSPVPALTMIDQFKSGATHAPSVDGHKFIQFSNLINRETPTLKLHNIASKTYNRITHKLLASHRSRQNMKKMRTHIENERKEQAKDQILGSKNQCISRMDNTKPGSPEEIHSRVPMWNQRPEVGNHKTPGEHQVKSLHSVEILTNQTKMTENSQSQGRLKVLLNT